MCYTIITNQQPRRGIVLGNSMKKTVLLILIIGFLLPATAHEAMAANYNPVVRIGLYFGSSTLISANLENERGSGYNLGWFDSSYEFIPVGWTEVQRVTTMKDKNIFLQSGNYYDTPLAGEYSVIGAYHLQASSVYSTFEEALAAAESFSGIIPSFPAYIDGQYRVRMGSFTSVEAAQAKAAELGYTLSTVVGNSPTCYTLTETRTANILFEFDYSGRTAFGIMPDITGDSDPQTWFKNNTYRGGFEYKRLSGNDITVINYVRLQDYVKGILPYEMSSSWPMEALKAQALCAKGYTLSNMGKHSVSGFDLCNTTDCQVYRGTYYASSNSDKAVDDTYGEFLLYNGEHVCAYYHSCDGGATEDACNVWGKDIPYLKGVIDPYEDIGKTWRLELTLEQLNWLAGAKGYSFGNLVNIYVSETTPMGNVRSITLVNSSGKSYSLSGEAARTFFYTPTLGNTITSQRYTITPKYDRPVGSPVYINGASYSLKSLKGVYAIGGSGKAQLTGDSAVVITGSGNAEVTASGADVPPIGFTISGSGYGHNIGMSQWGAYAMAQKGFTYDQILKFYYTGVTIGSLG
jgi:stage II sporulation protein D